MRGEVRGRKGSGGNREVGIRMSWGGYWAWNLGIDDGGTQHKYLMNVLGDGDELSRNGLEMRTIAAADLLVIERLLKVHGESLGAAMAATVPCLRCRRCLRLGFRSHPSVGGRRSGVDGFLEWCPLLRISMYALCFCHCSVKVEESLPSKICPKTAGRQFS